MMKPAARHSLLLLFLGTFLSSCSLIGLNLKHKAPDKPKRYPAFTEKDSLAGYLSASRSCFDVYYYDLNISFDLEKRSVRGYVDIHLMALAPFDSIQLDLRENMKLTSVNHGQNTLSFTRKFNTVFVTMGRKVPRGEKLVLRMAYEGVPVIAKRPPWEGGFVWRKDSEKQPWAGVACEQLGANSWWPLKDHLSDEPDSAAINLTVPRGLVCVSNGRLKERVLKENNTEEFRWRVNYPINTYNITFYIGSFEHFTIAYDSTRGKYLHFYVLKKNLGIAQKHFQQAVKVIRVFEELFGEYAFWNDGYKLVESPYAGMEHQSAIAYGNSYRNSYHGMDYIIVHETAHEWWGNAVSVGDFADVWIHEGMATYSEALYLEKTKDFHTALDYLYVYGMLVANKKPVVGPRAVNYWNYKDSDPYVKGAMMIHSLRSTLANDSLFFDIIRSFYAQYKYGIVTSSHFTELVNQKTGNDYSWFFNQFLHKHKPAAFTYKIDKKNKQLRYRWTDTDAGFKMPVIIYDGGKNIRLHPTTTEQVMPLEHPDQLGVDEYFFYFRRNKQ